jgi:hypothetical protein
VARALPAPTVNLVLRAAPVFRAAVTVTSVPDGPERVDSVIHEAGEDVTDQLGWLVVTTVVSVPPPAGKAAEAGANATTAGAAAWLTVYTADALPAWTVNEVERAAPVFASARTLIAAPVTPDVAPSDTQAAGPEATCQAGWFVVTVVLAIPPPAAADHDLADSDTVAAAACAIEYVARAEPADTVKLVVRALPVLAATVTVTEAPGVPLLADRTAQDAGADADHEAWLVDTTAAADPPP